MERAFSSFKLVISYPKLRLTHVVRGLSIRLSSPLMPPLSLLNVSQLVTYSFIFLSLI